MNGNCEKDLSVQCAETAVNKVGLSALIMAFKVKLLAQAENGKYVRLCTPLPVRLLRRPAQTVHLRAFHGDQVSEAHLGAPARPDRHPYRGAARGIREALQRPLGGIVRGHPQAGGSSAAKAA
jgi:hypothetical protein